MKFLQSKKIQLVLTMLLSIVIIAAGSFAWFSATQSALNEFTWNPEGVNLHDDFTEPNKDVYVENSGTSPLIVRVKLSEFMSYGNPGSQVAFPAGAQKENKDTWHTHNSLPTYEECGEEFHTFWEWKMGGQKWYLPASLEQMVLEGEQAVVKDSLFEDGLPKSMEQYYDTYKELTDIAYGDTILQDKLTALELAKRSLGFKFSTGDQEDIDIARASLTSLQIDINEYAKTNYHGLQLTRAATILTMTEWINGDGSRGPMESGDFWVVDTTNGWAYWASPLEPGEATGLLVDAVKPTAEITTLKMERKRYYYGIDVSMQSTTADDVGKFSEEAYAGIGEEATVEAEILLNAIANSITLGASSEDFTLRTAEDPEHETGLSWYQDGDIWKFDDGHWRYDGFEWTLDYEIYPFTDDGWLLLQDEWYYLDEFWYYDGITWYKNREFTEEGEESDKKPVTSQQPSHSPTPSEEIPEASISPSHAPSTTPTETPSPTPTATPTETPTPTPTPTPSE